MSEELKPVKCGCGGEAIVDQTDGYDEYQVYCPKCFMSSGTFNTEAEAITAWNRAIPIAEKSSTVERTAKAEYSNADGEYLCSECGRVVQIEDAYCCGCGARLEWE